MASKFSFNKLFSSISKIVGEDVDAATRPQKSHRQKAHDEEIQNAILMLAADVIRCNRNFTSDTEKHIEDFLTKHFGAVGVKHKMKSISGHLDTGTEAFTKVACKELKMLTTYDSRLSIIDFLLSVAGIDDFINAKEIRCIQRIAGYLGISDKDLKSLKNNYTGKNNPYHYLGLDEGATFEEVKTAYRKMVLKYHPDKRKSGNDEEANAKFREIKRAFETIKSY